MSEQENPSDRTSHTLTAVLVETAANKPVAPLSNRTDEETSTLHQKCAPAKTKISSERHKQVAKKLSSSIPSKRRDVSPAGMPMSSLETDIKLDEIVVMTAPIQPIPLLGKAASPLPTRDKNEEKDDADSITSEITELQAAQPAKRTPEWFDEEEAGGLPRSESRASRASRVSRVVRQFFCCGLQLEAPSEENVSSPREEFFSGGI